MLLPANALPAAQALAPGGAVAALFWVERTELTAAERRRHPAWCAGAYRLPPVRTEPASSWDGLPILAEADQIDYSQHGQVRLSGDVTIIQGGRTLDSAQAVFNQRTQQAALGPRALVRDGDLVLQGDAAQVNLESGAAAVADAQFLLAASALRGAAGAVSRDAQGAVHLQRSQFTRCAPGSRAWVLSAKRLHLPEGEVFGVAKGALLKIRGVPVLYTPYIKFPVSDERQSGFLFPQLGFSGKHGANLGAPYYLNLAANQDATLTPRLLSRRGVGLEGEYRRLSRWERTSFTAGYLPEDDLYDGEFDRDDWRRQLAAGTVQGDFNPADRWMLGMSHRGRLGRLRSRIDYARVSDRDYFRTLGGDVAGRNQISLLRHGELSYRQGGLLMRLWAQGFQRLDEIQGSEYERRPQLDILYNGQLGRGAGLGALQFSLAALAASFDRDNKGFQGVRALTGERLHLEPRLALPLRWPFGFLSASGGYRYTAYKLRSDAGPVPEAKPERGIPMGALGGGLIFERSLNAFGVALVQTLEPRLQYLYQGYEDQDHLPLFDAKDLTFSYLQLFRENRFSGLDRIGDANQLSMGLTTRFIDGASGREHLRASLGQIRHFRRRRVTLSGHPTDNDLRQASALAGELSATFANRWQLSGTLIWDQADNRVDEGAGVLSYRSGGRRILNMAYRNRIQDDIDQTDISLHWPLGDNYALMARWNYDLAGGRTIEGMGGLEYNDCCWRIRLLARRYLDHAAARSLAHVDSDSGVFLQLLFKGLGGLGGRMDSLLERSIRGYVAENR